MKSPKLKNISGAIFDLDGTLFDSTHVWSHIDDVFLAKRGKVPTTEYRCGLAALGTREVAYYTIDYYGLPDTPEQLLQEWYEMAKDEYANSIKLLPGVKAYLEHCRANNIKMAIVTSLTRELAEVGLKSNGIADFFDDIITADECGLSKSAPDIFTYTARRLGVAPNECVVFDDVSPVIRSAKLAGMTTVAVRDEKSSREDVPLYENTADFVIVDLTEAPMFK